MTWKPKQRGPWLDARCFTMIIPYYENRGMLAKQYDHLLSLNPEVRAFINLIICDDGSPTSPASPPDGIEGRIEYDQVSDPHWSVRLNGEATALGLRSFQLWRVDKDVRWNWLACRNIGAHYADTQWILMTDIDHLLPEATAIRIIEGPLDPACAYMFSRVDAPDMAPALDRHGKHKPHPNTWLMTKQMFDKVDGYDESFSGFYGTDGMFRRRVERAARGIITLPENMIRVPREVVPDASTTRYGRKEQQDREGVARIRAQREREGGPNKRLSFPYHRVI